MKSSNAVKLCETSMMSCVQREESRNEVEPTSREAPMTRAQLIEDDSAEPWLDEIEVLLRRGYGSLHSACGTRVVEQKVVVRCPLSRPPLTWRENNKKKWKSKRYVTRDQCTVYNDCAGYGNTHSCSVHCELVDNR